MAAQIAHDVVNEAQSVGDASLIDDTANSTSATPAGNRQAQLPPTDLNGDGSNREHLTNDIESVDAGLAVQDKEDEGAVVDLVVVDPSADGAGANSLVVDLSGGSDTDTSKADSLDQAKDGAKGHVRSNSVKKPAAFKSVSVTKNFLAKAATAAPSVRAGEKGSPASQSGASTPVNARPRLVAKTALGGSGSRSGLSRMNGAGGPDPLKVWNRNRPVAPPPPRQFTDEELKQQYGIHMATRLQSDESGKDKWADIEDDEDDWAPETVEWVDGTKSNVVPTGAHSTPLPLEEKKVLAIQKPETEESLRPSLQTAPPSSSTKTILKPGIHVSSQSKPSSAGGRSPADKPALVSKSPAPPPSKNPWAPLPPIDNVVPVFPNPPQPQASGPFRRDPHGFDSLPPPPPGPTREIAADDFNRSWREDRGTKELYNSRSGRYEPVNEMRRGSMREEQAYRQPPVLQRPLYSDRPAPAEPSPAFQTHRSSGADSASWSRRRTSSNVSSSGGRRPSFSRAMDSTEGFSPTSGPVVESPRQDTASIERGVLPGMASQRGWTMASPIYQEQSSPVRPPQEAGPEGEAVADVAQEDPVVRQQRLMRDGIEAARSAKQKKLEEEQIQEAAKMERLKKKMEALEAATPSPELKETKTKEPTYSAPRSPLPVKHAPIISPPKPPIPTAEGEVAQYGVMKVHQPHPVKRAVVNEAALEKKAYTNLPGSSRDAPGVARPPQPVSALGASGTNKPVDLEDQHRIPATDSDAWRQAAASPSAYNWGNNGAKSYSSHNNVWGPPPNNSKRGLGNGTFGSYNSRDEQQQQQQPLTVVKHASLLESPASPPTAYKSFSPPTSRPHQLHSSFSPSPQLSQLPQHSQQPPLPNLSSDSFTTSSYHQPDESTSKMGLSITPTASTFAEAGAFTKPAEVEKAVENKAEQHAAETAAATSFSDATRKALKAGGQHISGPGMKPIFTRRFDWNLNNDATTETKSQAWSETFKAAHELEKAERSAMFSQETAFVSLKLEPAPTAKTPTTSAPLQLPAANFTLRKSKGDSMATKETSIEEAGSKEPAEKPKPTFVPPHLRLQARKSKFQPIFDGQRADSVKPTEPTAADMAPAIGGPPAGTEHLFSTASTGPKVKIPVIPKVKLPNAGCYKHLDTATTPAQNAVHWQHRIHNLIHDNTISAATKVGLVLESQPPRVNISRATAEAIIRYRELPGGIWDSRWARPGMQAAYHDWKACVKPTDEELFEEPQFASRPNVCAPKKPHHNAHLPPVHVDETPRHARNDPIVASAVSIEIAPIVFGGAMHIRVMLPGANKPQVFAMPMPTARKMSGVNPGRFIRGDRRAGAYGGGRGPAKSGRRNGSSAN